MNLKVKIYLEDENDKFMGIGVLWLLQKIETCGSLRSAAKELGISYSKAYLMIQNLERSLDKTIIDRKHGGQGRDGSSLTPYAKSFIALYDEFQKNCKNLLEVPFDKFRKDMQALG